jgi:energy-converting hydrogenase Eha subunit C
MNIASLPFADPTWADVAMMAIIWSPVCVLIYCLCRLPPAE